MTFQEFQAKVQRVAKINSRDETLVTLIKDAINVALYDIAREQKWAELLVLRHSLDLTNAASGTLITIPADFIEAERLRYKVGTQIWRLYPVGAVLPPPIISGRPREYQFATGSPISLSIEPYAAIEVGDSLLLDYYKSPVELVADEDAPVSNLWDNEILKRAAHYVLTYSGRTAEAQQMWQTRLLAMKQQTQQPSP